MRKFDKYVNSLDNCIHQVVSAMQDGALLTDLEMFDFYFKSILNESKVGILQKKESTYKLASLYARVFEDIEALRREGYNNKLATILVKKICRQAFLLGVSSRYTVEAYDSNGILYFELYQGNLEVEKFSVKGINSLTKVLLALTSYIGTASLEEGEFKTFAETYLIETYNDMMSCNEPKPYTYKGTAKTLKSFLRKKKDTAVKEGGKIIEFRAG